MARARVRGFQAANLASERRIVACPKHYAAYGAAEAGKDYNTVDISERTLRDVQDELGNPLDEYSGTLAMPAGDGLYAGRIQSLHNEWAWVLNSRRSCGD